MYQTKFAVKIDKEVYHIPYPNVGQQLEIEGLKELLSAGKYSELARTGSKTAIQLLDLIDAVSYFYTLVPELKAKLDLKNFTNIDPLFQKKLSKAFIQYNQKFIIPCDLEINKELSEEDEDEEKQA